MPRTDAGSNEAGCAMVPRRSRRSLAFLGVAVASVVLGACGGGGDGDRDGVEALSEADLGGARAALAIEGVTSEADDDIRYFSDVQAAFDLFGSRAAAASQESLEGGDEREVFFGGLVNQGAGTAFIDSLEALRAITPSRGYEIDHARIVQLYEELVRTDALFGEAAAAQDWVRLVANNSQLGRHGALAALDLSPNTCTLVTAEEFCDRHVTSGTAYEQGMNDAGLRWEGPRGGVLFNIAPTDDNPFAAGLATREERLAIIEELTTFALDGDAEYLANVRQRTPDAAYVEDHARVIAFVENTQSLHEDVLAAAQAGDFVALMLLEDALFAEDLAFFSTTSAATCELFGIGGPGGEPCGLPGDAPSAAPTDAYSVAVINLNREFVARSGPAGIEPWNPLLTDEETASVLGTLAERRAAFAREVVTALEGLTPRASQADDHTILLSVAAELVEIEQGLVDSYAAGTLGALAIDGPEVAAWVANACRLPNELSAEGLVLVAPPAFAVAERPPGAPPDPLAGIDECFAAALR